MRPPPPRRKALHHAIIEDGRLHREIAEASHLSDTALSMILRGVIVNPKPATRARIADALGVEEEAIFPEFCEVDDLDPADPWQSIIDELTAAK